MTERTPEGWRIENCRSCDAPMIWASTPKGKNLPANVEPVDDGNIELTATTPGRAPVATVLTGPSLIDGKRYTSHFTTCPDAEKWRKQ